MPVPVQYTNSGAKTLSRLASGFYSSLAGGLVVGFAGVAAWNMYYSNDLRLYKMLNDKYAQERNRLIEAENKALLDEAALARDAKTVFDAAGDAGIQSGDVARVKALVESAEARLVSATEGVAATLSSKRGGYAAAAAAAAAPAPVAAAAPAETKVEDPTQTVDLEAARAAAVARIAARKADA